MNQEANMQVEAGPSELRDMIAATVDRLFADQVSALLQRDFDGGRTALADGLWQNVVELGLDQALVLAEAGGSGATWQESYPIFRAIGYRQAPLPLAETMLAGLLLARAGLAPSDLTPGTPMTVIESGRHGDLRILETPEGWIVSGTATDVAWAQACRYCVISGGRECDRIALVDLRQSSVHLDGAKNLAGEPHDTVRFTEAKATVAAKPYAALSEPVWVLGALMRAAMMTGALESMLEVTVAYANERVQFGRPLGKFQAIQHALAELAGALGSALVAVQVAFAAASSGEEGADTLAFDVAVAKVRSGEAATRANAIAHQVFGAIGFTQEHTLHFATRRLWSWRAEFGSDAQWAEALGRAAMAAGSKGFWAGLTARQL